MNVTDAIAFAERKIALNREEAEFEVFYADKHTRKPKDRAACLAKATRLTEEADALALLLEFAKVGAGILRK